MNPKLCVNQFTRQAGLKDKYNDTSAEPSLNKTLGMFFVNFAGRDRNFLNSRDASYQILCAVGGMNFTQNLYVQHKL